MPPVTRTDFPYPLRTVDGEVDVEVDNLTVNGDLTVENFIFINDITVNNAIINNNLAVGNTVSTVNVNATNIIAGTMNSTSLTTTTINSQSVTTNSFETVSAKITGLANLSAVATNATNDLISVPNTGSGNNVLQTTPTLITPILGDAQATSLTLSTPLPPSSGGTGQTSLSLVSVGNATQASESTNLSGGSLGQIPVQSGPSTTTFLNPGLSGQILTSNGTQPSYQFPALVPLTSGVSGILPPTNGGTGQTSLSLVTVGNATQSSQSTNISAGAIGQIPYQIAPSTTAFTGPGTPGQILTSNGNAQPTYQAPAIVSLTSGVSGTLPATNGGTGQTSLSLVTVGNSTTTQNLGGGAIGSVAVQTAVGVTGFVGVGIAGTILTSNGTNPVYQPPAIVSLTTGVSGVLPVVNGGTGQTTLSAVTVGNATNAVSSVNLSGGSLGSVAVQTGVGSTGFIAAGLAGTILTSNGTTVSYQPPATVGLGTGVSGVLPVVNGGTGQTSLSVVSVGFATNLNGGLGGSLPYQTGVDATSMLPIGAGGFHLISNGSVPTWQMPYPKVSWTPTIVYTGGGGTITSVAYTVQDGKYTQINQCVLLRCSVSFITSGGGGSRIGVVLPFIPDGNGITNAIEINLLGVLLAQPVAGSSTCLILGSNGGNQNFNVGTAYNLNFSLTIFI